MPFIRPTYGSRDPKSVSRTTMPDGRGSMQPQRTATRAAAQGRRAASPRAPLPAATACCSIPAMRPLAAVAPFALALLLLPRTPPAQSKAPPAQSKAPPAQSKTPPAQSRTPPAPAPDLRQLVTTYAADLRDLDRRYDVPLSAERDARLRKYLGDRRDEIQALDAATLARDARVDRWLLLADVDHRVAGLDHDRERAAQQAALLPHAEPLVAACEARRRMEPVDPEAAAAMLTAATATLDRAHSKLRDGAFDQIALPVARAAVATIDDL